MSRWQQLVAWGRAHLPWVGGALGVIALFIIVLLYGSSQYDRGRDLARADIADSISRVYEQHYQAFRDSTTMEIAQFKKGLAAANARADSADARTLRAQAQAAQVLTPTVIAKTPPEVIALIGTLRTALDSNTAALHETRAKLDTANNLIQQQAIALTLADTTIAQQRRAYDELTRVKTPPQGFWHQVGVVAKYAGVAAVGIAVGVIAH